MQRDSNSEPVETAGQEAVRFLKPGGCALVLIFTALFLFFCFKKPADLLPGYVPPNTSEYYAEHLDELKAELDANVLPLLPGAEGCEVTDGVITVRATREGYNDTRRSILDFYDSSLFVFEKIP